MQLYPKNIWQLVICGGLVKKRPKIKFLKILNVVLPLKMHLPVLQGVNLKKIYYKIPFLRTKIK